MVDSDVDKALAEVAGRLSAAVVGEVEVWAVDIEGVRSVLRVRRLRHVWTLLLIILLLLEQRMRSLGRWKTRRPLPTIQFLR